MIRYTLTRVAESAAVAVLALATVAGIAGAGYVTRDREPFPVAQLATADTRGGYPACVSDEPDGNRPCVWDARHQGNGIGRSYLVTRSGRVIYLPHRAAHALQSPGVY